MIPTSFLGLPQSIEIDERGQINSGRALMGPLYPWVFVRWWSRFFFGVRVGVWRRWFAHLFVMLSAGGMCSSLLLLQTPRFLLLALQKWQLGFLVSVSFGSRICPNCTWLFLVPYNFYFLAGGEVCSDASFAALQRRVPGLSQKVKKYQLAVLCIYSGDWELPLGPPI